MDKALALGLNGSRCCLGRARKAHAWETGFSQPGSGIPEMQPQRLTGARWAG